MLRHTKGNLISLAEAGEFDVIVHGCNCQNTMGSGIAKEIRTRYPEAYLADAKTLRGEKAKVGSFTLYDTGQFIIINAYTQYHYLPRGVDHFEYAGFERILHRLLDKYGGVRYGFPYIGMGLAGGDSDRIFNILKEFSSMAEEIGGTATVVEYKA